MPEQIDKNVSTLQAEIVRLNKMVQALMNRVESSMSVDGSYFSMFQTTIMLEEQVRNRTEELEAALHMNEKILRELRESEAKFHSLVDQSLVGIAIIEDDKFSYANPKLASVFGYSVEELFRIGPQDVVIEMDRPKLSENILANFTGGKQNTSTIYLGLRKDGSHAHIEAAFSPMSINGKPALIMILADISERVLAETKVLLLNAQQREIASHDALTGLFNRRYLEDTFERELIRAERQSRSIGLIMGDLDHFKLVNDSYGHQAGDEVLREIGRLMKQHIRGSDIYCRYGGEEFLLILPDMQGEKTCERAEQLRLAIAASPIRSCALTIQTTISFGVAVFPQHGRTSAELIAAADHALYVAKQSGRNQVRLFGASEL